MRKVPGQHWMTLESLIATPSSNPQQPTRPDYLLHSTYAQAGVSEAIAREKASEGRNFAPAKS
jgi:hypothetical protein